MMMPWRITIDTNPDQCNLNCIMCDTHSIYNDKSKLSRKSMDKNLLEKCINEAIDIGVKEIIPTTMGEPLLYKYFDIFIYKLLHSNVKLNLTTNGTFPNIGVEKWAEKLLPVLSDIKISVNAVDQKINETIMINDNTTKKLEDIKTFAQLRDRLYPNVSITLQVTFLTSNIEDLDNIIKYAINHKINRVKGHHLWITYSQIKDESLQNSQEKIDIWNDFINKIDKYRDKIELVNFEKIEMDTDDYIMQKQYDCPFLGEELWIDHNGDFNICCAPSDKRRSLGSWGNIKDIKITEIFNSQQYKELCANYKSKDICKVCPLRKA